MCWIDVEGQNFKNFDFYFDCNEDTINRRDNAEAIEMIKKAIPKDGSSSIKIVYVKSSSSPDGSDTYNIALAKRRLSSTIDLITSDKIAIHDSLLFVVSTDVAWDELRQLVENSDSPFDYEIIEMVDSQNLNLKSLKFEKPYQYIVKHILPQLRKSSVTIVYNNPYPEPIFSTVYNPIFPEFKSNFLDSTMIIKVDAANVEKITEPIETKPLLALKTNLLFDILTLINIEVEVPIKNRWSITGELTFPWWVWDNHKADSRRNRIELINGVIEGRYWLGNRKHRDVLTGWHLGLYAGCGLYDFEYKAKGYQGEFFVAAGLSGGYSHTINKAKTLRMEYSLGIGFLQTKYRYYNAEFCENEIWHAVECRRGNYNWIGPTRAKVSLSWLLSFKKRIKMY